MVTTGRRVALPPWFWWALALLLLLTGVFLMASHGQFSHVLPPFHFAYKFRISTTVLN